MLFSQGVYTRDSVSSIVSGSQMRIFFSLTYAPRTSFRWPWGQFLTVKKSSFEDPLTILLGFLKYFSTAAFCFLKCGFCKRISATPTERLIPPNPSPLFGALGRVITNWRKFCRIFLFLYIYIYQEFQQLCLHRWHGWAAITFTWI